LSATKPRIKRIFFAAVSLTVDYYCFFVYIFIEDPVIVLASTQTGSPTVDIGFIGERGTSNNIAFVWNESSDEFEFIPAKETINRNKMRRKSEQKLP
jgi:hypothetical protein